MPGLKSHPSPSPSHTQLCWRCWHPRSSSHRPGLRPQLRDSRPREHMLPSHRCLKSPGSGLGLCVPLRFIPFPGHPRCPLQSRAWPVETRQPLLPRGGWGVVSQPRTYPWPRVTQDYLKGIVVSSAASPVHPCPCRGRRRSVGFQEGEKGRGWLSPLRSS